MCRFVLYQGAPLTIASLVTEPVHSIINQSFKSTEAEEPLNGDGFGVAWYAPDLSPYPAAFRSVSPAWSNQNLLDLSRVTCSGNILAHVRAATPGLPVTELNCHPFTHGAYAFMHNGDVAGFRAIRREILGSLSDETFQAVKGSTDSEHLFAVFLDTLRKRPSPTTAHDPATVMADALDETIRRVLAMSRAAGPQADPGGDGQSDLNIALSNGVCSVACRFSTAPDRSPMSLYMHTGRRYVCEGGLCRMIEPEKEHGAVIVSSERLSDDPGWVTVPANHMVLVNEDLTCQVRPVAWAR